jgi:hypothetical protein
MKGLALALATTLGLALSASSVLAVGAGEKCGGIVPIPCDSGLWCQFKTGTCGAFDVQGTCAKVPEVCAQIVKPVCGCDGKTYANDCLRRMAKVSLKAVGNCNM